MIERDTPSEIVVIVRRRSRQSHGERCHRKAMHLRGTTPPQTSVGIQAAQS
jgi:hypothetical protein